jgi:hypothetical protein
MFNSLNKFLQDFLLPRPIIILIAFFCILNTWVYIYCCQIVHWPGGSVMGKNVKLFTLRQLYCWDSLNRRMGAPQTVEGCLKKKKEMCMGLHKKSKSGLSIL